MIETKHELKIWPQFFEALVAGVKRYEVRKDDRDFQVGDLIRWREFEPGPGYTGREAIGRVEHVTREAPHGILPDGIVVFGVTVVAL